MIWQDDNMVDPQREAIASRILVEVPNACGNPALAAHPRVTEAALGVAAYLDEQTGTAADLDGRLFFDLMSRALNATGDRSLAWRVQAFSRALVYPSRWAATGDQRVWVLDLKRLLEPQEHSLELAFFERLRGTLDAVADIWDAADGNGILGLRNLTAAAGQVLGTGASRRPRRAFADEIPRYCVRRLESLRTTRQWRGTPLVICLHS